MIIVDGVSLHMWRKNYARIFGAERPVDFTLLSQRLGELLIVVKGNSRAERFINGLKTRNFKHVVVDSCYYNAHTITCAQFLADSKATGIVTSDQSFIPIAKQLGKKIYSCQYLSDPVFLRLAEGEDIDWLKSDTLIRASA